MALTPYVAPTAFITGLTTFAGILNLALGYKPFPTSFDDSASSIYPQSLSDQIHTRELQLRELTTPSFYEKWFGNPVDPEEYLNFDSNCKKEKFLFLSAADDHNGALHPKYILEMLQGINEKYDVKYKVVASEQDVCEQISKAAAFGKLTNLGFHAHSDSKGICLSNCESLNGWLHMFKSYKECFKPLDISGRITLIGSKTGLSFDGNPKNNIAQKIASDSKLEVIAPVDFISSSGIELPNTKKFELYQKAGQNKQDQKVFKLFQPIYEKCTKVLNTLHPREKDLITVVKEATEKDSYLIYPEELEQHLLKLCTDSEKQKFLFLSASEDWNGALKPAWNPDLFKTLAESYDFKFKVVRSYEEICKEAKEASQTGEFVHLVLHLHGNREGAYISGNLNSRRSWLLMDTDFTCLRSLPDSVKITLISCMTGMPNELGDIYDNFASAFAKKTGKEVVAPIDNTTLGYVKGYENSFEIRHLPINPNIKENNIFKKFTP